MLRHDEAKMKEALENYIKTNLVPTLELLEKRLEDNGTGYMFGNKVIRFRYVRSVIQKFTRNLKYYFR